ncbi:MAG: ABC transporter substrate-binding protein [Thermoprotei archaeon]
MTWFRKLLMISSIVLIALLLVWVQFNLINPVAKLESISLGVEFNTHATPVWVALHADLFSKHNLNITTLLKFRTGAELAAAMARGDVDAGWACLGPILNIIDQGIDVKIIAKIHNYGYALVVNPSKISSVKDLNNTIVYSTGLPNPTNLLLIRIQDLYGIKFSIKPVGDPQTLLSMLVSGQIDAASLPEHYVSVAESKGARVLLRAQDVWPGMPGSYLIVRSDVLKRKPDIVKKLLDVSQEALKIIKNNEELVVQASSAELGIDKEVALKSINNLEWVELSTGVDVREIQEYIDFMFAHGLLKNRLNATEIVYRGVS